ncbi:MGH1-like glycoside hydrolase domain-containing protein [Jiangella alba]|uniref:Mannosylglycerate hydrolase MGH1-like glycoside hydrolase domain-containing protein n=1 Tax=Jiangella alba TaxID=561176 RepID=A0A1H5IV25_9ACTN|nr:hypothetical protein [Jiangella alba]SEE44076.1 hypothetical protein SAMN04488561_1330 [Jiangella alba]
MRSIDDALVTGRRGLRTRPGTLLLGPTGARLWADYLDERPGFAGAIDLVHKLNIPLLFTVSGVELPAPWDARWRPSRLTVSAVSPGGVELVEDKFVTWDDCAVSRQLWTNRGADPVALRLDVDRSWIGADGFGSRPVERHGFTVVALVRSSEPALWDGLTIQPGAQLDVVVAAALGLAETDTRDDLAGRLDGVLAVPANGATIPADHEAAPATPAAAPADGATIPAHDTTAPANGATIPANHDAALAYGATTPAHGAAAPATPAAAPADGTTVPTNGTATRPAGDPADPAAGGDGRAAAAGRSPAPVSSHPVIHRQEQSYQRWFDPVPSFSCSDALLTRTWAYRWFLLRHNLAVPGIGGLPDALFYEGRAHKMTKTPWHPAGWEFSKLIPLSSPMHLLEARWHPDPSLGTGLWRTLRAAQGDDGLYRSRTVAGEFHAYANFLGWASYQYALVHRDADGAAAMRDSLAAQVRGERAKLATGGDELPIETEHILTGKEYQPSYWAFHDYPADPRDRSGYTPLKRVDRAIYHYLNARGVAGLTRLLGGDTSGDTGGDGPAAEFDALADAVAADVLAKQWDGAPGFFYDLHHRTDEKAMVRNVVGFYPYWAGIVGADHLPGFEAALRLFGTGAPLPSTAPDSPVYSATGDWRGVFVKGRNGCSWNGPTWPYTNSVVIDGVGATSRRFGHRYDAAFGRLLRSYALLHFQQRDGRTPYLVEHYNSETGEAISDEVDYLHSFVIDLLVRYVAGLEAGPGAVTVDPLDIGLTWFELRGVRVAGHTVDIAFDAQRGLRVSLDGVEAAVAPGLAPLTVALT